MVRIDAHQHFWRYLPTSFGWIAPGSVLAADRLPGQLRAELDAAKIDCCIAVQAQQCENETAWMLELANANAWIGGVIGWVDLASNDIEERLSKLMAPRLVGIRHIAQDEPDPRYLLRPEVIRGICAVVDHGLAFDILVRGDEQLEAVAAFSAQIGQGNLVLDHGGKPDIAGGGWDRWAAAITVISGAANVTCKLSGLVTEADHKRWKPEEMTRYLNHLLESFGPTRLIFGSDWPVCELAASYARVLDLIESFVADTCPDHRDEIFGGTASRVYGRGEFAEYRA